MEDILELRLHAPLDAQHLLESVLVAVLDLELLPLLPERRVDARVAELAGVAVDRARAVDLAQPALHLGELDAHGGGLLVRQGGDGALVDGAGGGEAEVGRGLCDVELEHICFVFVGDGAGGAFVDAHGVAGEAAFFLERAVHEVDGFGEFGRAVFDGLFEEIPEALDADLAVHGFGQVEVPEFESDRVREEIQATLVDLEALFEIAVLFQQVGVIDDSLWCGDAKLENALVHLLGLFQC